MVWAIAIITFMMACLVVALIYRRISARGAIADTPTQLLIKNAQFTVFRPKTIKPSKWYPLLAFAHLSELTTGGHETETEPVEEVNRQAKLILGEQFKSYQHVTQDSSKAVPREGELKFVPDILGIEFNPPFRSFSWHENVHREDFRLRASPKFDGKTAKGGLFVFWGSILLAEINLSINIDSQKVIETPSSSFERNSAPVYRKIFASYSHKDEAIVKEFENYARALGDQYLRDLISLRAGEFWSDRLTQMIEQANIFQLFWSWNSIKSKFVEQEWRYALALKRQHFIRPVYWEEPLPEMLEEDLPPKELRALHFQRIYPLILEKAKDLLYRKISDSIPMKFRFPLAMRGTLFTITILLILLVYGFLAPSIINRSFKKADYSAAIWQLRIANLVAFYNGGINKISESLQRPLALQVQLTVKNPDGLKWEYPAESNGSKKIKITPKDDFRLTVTFTQGSAYLYIFLVDRYYGRIQKFFPNPEFSEGSNPIQSNFTYNIPSGHWFYLEEHDGKSITETTKIIYIIGSPWRANDIELLYEKIYDSVIGTDITLIERKALIENFITRLSIRKESKINAIYYREFLIGHSR